MTNLAKATQFLLLLVFVTLSLTTKAAEARCSGYSSPMTMAGMSGVITSPRYPSTYNVFENCVWTSNYFYTHANHMVLFDVLEVQTSYRRINDKINTCTGHLSFFGEETDCRASKPFCNIFYARNACKTVADQLYARCKQIKKSTLIPTEIKFKSDTFFTSQIRQRGFKINYKIIDCNKALTTTTTPTTTATTTTTTTTTTSTPTTAPPTTTTPRSTTPTTTIPPTTTTTSTTLPLTTTTSTTLPSTTTTTSTTPRSTKTITSSTTTASLLQTSSEPSQSSQSTTSDINLLPSTSMVSEPTIAQKNSSLLGHIITTSTSTLSGDSTEAPTASRMPNDSDVTSKKLQAQSSVDNNRKLLVRPSSRTRLSTTTLFPCDSNSESGGCNQPQVASSLPILWIVVPVVILMLIIGTVLLVVLSKRRKKKSLQEMAYLVGFENRNYGETKKSTEDGTTAL